MCIKIQKEKNLRLLLNHVVLEVMQEHMLRYQKTTMKWKHVVTHLYEYIGLAVYLNFFILTIWEIFSSLSGILISTYIPNVLQKDGWNEMCQQLHGFISIINSRSYENMWINFPLGKILNKLLMTFKLTKKIMKYLGDLRHSCSGIIM